MDSSTPGWLHVAAAGAAAASGAGGRRRAPGIPRAPPPWQRQWPEASAHLQLVVVVRNIDGRLAGDQRRYLLPPATRGARTAGVGHCRCARGCGGILWWRAPPASPKPRAPPCPIRGAIHSRRGGAPVDVSEVLGERHLERLVLFEPAPWGVSSSGHGSGECRCPLPSLPGRSTGGRQGRHPEAA